MAGSIALPRLQPLRPYHHLLRLAPGVLLLAAIGYGGKFLERAISHYAKAHHLVIPNIEYVLWAILIGLVISNVFGVPDVFRPGIATYEFWLKAGIVLLGSRFLLGDVLHLGGISLGLVALELIVALSLMTLLGRLFGLRPKLISLLAVGSAVCGVSAIIMALRVVLASTAMLEAESENSAPAAVASAVLSTASPAHMP